MNRIHVALIVEDALWGPAYAAMRSVCLSTMRKADLVFHVFHAGLSAPQLYTLQRIPAEFSCGFLLYDIDGDSLFAWLEKQAPRAAGVPDPGYAVLLFGETLPREVERLVHLDCRMLVRAPIERIAELELAGHSVAAAADARGQQVMTGRMMVDPRGIFDAGMRYFNTGLMVIEMARWRELRLVGKFEAMLDSGRLQELRSAADFLNLAVGADWQELDQLWNFADPRPLHEPLNPSAVRYAGRRRPWNPLSRVAYARTYRYTMTNDVYYRFLAERLPTWLRPLVMWIKRSNG